MTDAYYGSTDNDADFITDDIELGTEGDHVRELQQRMNEVWLSPFGVEIEVNGVFDEVTKLKLTEFAESHGVNDGSSASAINQLVAETGVPLEDPEWKASYTSSILFELRGEQAPKNPVWSGDARDRTYYPVDSTAQTDYGYEIKDGKLGREGEEPLDTTGITTRAGMAGSQPERMIFTMGTEGDFRLADPTAEQDSRDGLRFHHSSLASGGSVAAAGEMKVREGVVEAVSDKSGHYRPDFAQTQQVADALKEQGVDTDKVTFELGSFGRKKPSRGDGTTRVSGAEMLSYDRDAILSDVRQGLRTRAVESAKKSDGWEDLSKEAKAEVVKERYEALLDGDDYKKLRQLDDRSLLNQARNFIDSRHEAYNQVLTQTYRGKGWAEDPSQRHQYRWFDGKFWTGRVSDSDKESVDDEGAVMLGAPVKQQQPRQDTAGRAAASSAELNDDEIRNYIRWWRGASANERWVSWNDLDKKQREVLVARGFVPPERPPAAPQPSQPPSNASESEPSAAPPPSGSEPTATVAPSGSEPTAAPPRPASSAPSTPPARSAPRGSEPTAAPPRPASSAPSTPPARSAPRGSEPTAAPPRPASSAPSRPAPSGSESTTAPPRPGDT